MNKTILALIMGVLVLGLAANASAQGPGTYKTITIYGTSVADSSLDATLDTTTAFTIGAYPVVSCDVYSADRVNLLNIHIMKQEEGKSGYTVVDSLVAWNGSSNGVLNRKEFMLRDGSVNKLAGLRASFKLRPQYAGSGNDNARVYIRVHYGGM